MGLLGAKIGGPLICNKARFFNRGNAFSGDGMTVKGDLFFREVKARGLNYYGGLAVTPPTLHGGHYEVAANAPSARAGTVVPTGELPSTDQEPADPATVGGATTDRSPTRGESARDPRG